MSRVTTEKILCAAIWFDDGIVHAHQPINIEIGIVYMGFRHCNCFASVGGLVRERIAAGIEEKEQGFLTNYNRFVGRKEALVIALKENQVLDINNIRGNILYSEDLY